MPVVSAFRWEGKGIPASRRKVNELHYKAFKNGNLKVAVGDNVLIRNDDSLDPEDNLNCYIAQVIDMFDTGEGEERFRAKVQWFTRVIELSPQYARMLKDADYQREIVEEQRSHWDNVIDAESIFSKCVIIYLHKESSPASQPPARNKKLPVFYCRFKFTGLRFIPKDPKQADAAKENNRVTLYGTPKSRKSSKTDANSPSARKIYIDGLRENTSEGTEACTPIYAKSIDFNGITLKPVMVAVPRIEEEIFNYLHGKDVTYTISDKCFEVQTPPKLPDASRKNKVKQSDTSPVLEITHLTVKTEPSSENPSETPKKKYSRTTPRNRKCRTDPQIRRKKDPSAQEKSSRRLLDFSSTGGESNCSATVTRYGRKVKPVSNVQDSDVDDLIFTPKKAKLAPKRDFAVRSNAKFYNPNVSDSDGESLYAPSDHSESEEEIFPVTRIEKTTPKQAKSNNHSSVTPKSSRKSNSAVKGSRTPSYKKHLKSVTTPTIPERVHPVGTPKSLIEESRQRLHVSAVPSSLPCREEEYADIYAFIESNLLDGTGGCMYISGVPGTGKTATVHEVMRNLERERDNNKLPPFQFIEVNGMKLTDPYQCYVQIFKQLTGERIAPQQAAKMLEKRFTQRGPKKQTIVLLVDELDKLWTRKQTVMYNIFDWPTKPSSKLIVIAVANTLDLPERLMMNRISSRLGLTRKTFQPYTFKELQEIVMSRIKELQVFDSDAVQLVARKVAAVSGDARRALEICKRAAEIAEEGTIRTSPTKKKKVLVGMAHVDVALQQMLSSPEVTAIRGCSELQKMFFKSVIAEFERTGCEETTLFRVYRQLVGLCRFEGLRPPTTSEVSALCCHLASSYLILIDNVQNDLFMKIRLNISIDDVSYALTVNGS